MFFLTLFSKLPFPLLYFLADFFYIIITYLFQYRKSVISENLKNAFPTLSKKERFILRRNFYRNLVDISLETLKAPGLSKKALAKRVIIKNIKLVHQAIERSGTAIVLSGHQANWEWLLLASSLSCQYPIDAVYKPMHIKSLDRFFINLRSLFGATLIPMQEVYRTVIANKGKKRVLAMVADQTPAHGEIQFFTKFLHQETAFFVGADKLARHTNAPVFFGEMKRIRRGFYEVEFRLLANPPFPENSFSIIKAYVHELEKSIEQHPADWLWSHRRWKYQTPKLTRAAR